MPVQRDWKDVFLAELRLSPNVSRAARAADVGRQTAYDARAVDPAFARAWDDAIEESVDAVQDAAFQRAMADSDTLAIFLLKSHRPSVYNRPQQVEHVVSEPKQLTLDDADTGTDDPRPAPDA